MSIIQDKISAIAPEAVFTQGQYPTFTVPAEKLREVALELRNDSDLLFDYMVSLTGVDAVDGFVKCTISSHNDDPAVSLFLRPGGDFSPCPLAGGQKH